VTLEDNAVHASHNNVPVSQIPNQVLEPLGSAETTVTWYVTDLKFSDGGWRKYPNITA
jgi:hypothetical protein